ncbi:uncharacterized protein LOC110185163 [Drosophila serrata]|uniref:uncharacterized protein LOC110185163 n=1 Tax=Drosophila serrata TaxID=7274 RepID=UPI000A1D0645|nr:uncharacterized protein LOC110185163 [Drosophila serrata]
MKPQTGRIVSLLYALLPLMIDAVCGRAQYASPYGGAGAYAIPGVQSIWSGSPIVVNDNQYSAQEQQRQYPNINGYYGDTSRPTYPSWRREDDTLPSYQPSWRSESRTQELQPPARYPNHNYNNVPGYFYYQQQETTPTTTPITNEFQQSYLPRPNTELESSDSRRDEEQVVQIGGSRSLATNNYQNVYTNNGNYYEPAQAWRQRDFQAKYAQHFANYLRKYPRRLQPVYDVGEDFDEK